jgi:hypothetical protein
MRGVGDVIGIGDGAATKRATLIDSWTEPKLSFQKRMQWLAKVQREAAETKERREYVPHKIMAVANVMAHVGEACRISIDGIAERAGCVPNTVKACIAWLEGCGALTWAHTTKRLGRKVVRSVNLYTLLYAFRGMLARVSRILRPIWRERGHAASKGNERHGETSQVIYTEQTAARAHLEALRKEREAKLAEQWANRRKAMT